MQTLEQQHPDPGPARSGKIRTISEATYRGLPNLSASYLKDVCVSPKFALHHRLVQKESPALTFGSAVHCAILQPAEYAQRYVVWTGGRRAGKEWEIFKAAHGEREILTADESASVSAIVRAVQVHPVASRLIAARGRTEVSIDWTHLRTGRACKSRIDKLTTEVLVELKTARAVAPARFAADAARMHYDLQLAFYADAVAAATGATPAVKVLAVETAAPHDVVVYSVDEELLTSGRLKYEAAIDAVLLAEETSTWPGIAETEEVPLRLPAWARTSEDDDDLQLTFNGEVM
jgi:hypothetical protein